jgi:hypothetical protein
MKSDFVYLKITEADECVGTIGKYLYGDALRSLNDAIVNSLRGVSMMIGDVPSVVTDNSITTITLPFKPSFTFETVSSQTDKYYPLIQSPSNREVLYQQQPNSYEAHLQDVNCQHDSNLVHHIEPGKSYMPSTLDLLQSLMGLPFTILNSIQVPEIVSALVQANKLPIDYNAIAAVESILSYILIHRNHHILRFGVIKRPESSILKGESEFKPYIMTDNTNYISTGLKANILVIDQVEFVDIQNNFYINFSFDVSERNTFTTDGTTIVDMKMVELNKYATQYRIIVKCDNNDMVAINGNIMTLPTVPVNVLLNPLENTSMFIIDSFEIEQVNGAPLRFLNSPEGIALLKPIVTVDKLELQQSGQYLLTLSNPTSDLIMHIHTTSKVARETFNIDYQKLYLTDQSALDVRHNPYETIYIAGGDLLAVSTGTISGDDATTSVVVDTSDQITSKNYNIFIPFTLNESIRDKSLIKLVKLTRTLDSVSGLYKIDQVVDVPNFVIRDVFDSSVGHDVIVITLPELTSDQEFVIEFTQGSLYGFKPLSSTVSEQVTNSRMVIDLEYNFESDSWEAIDDPSKYVAY